MVVFKVYIPSLWFWALLPYLQRATANAGCVNKQDWAMFVVWFEIFLWCWLP